MFLSRTAIALFGVFDLVCSHGRKKTKNTENNGNKGASVAGNVAANNDGTEAAKLDNNKITDNDSNKTTKLSDSEALKREEAETIKRNKLKSKLNHAIFLANRNHMTLIDEAIICLKKFAKLSSETHYFTMLLNITAKENNSVGRYVTKKYIGLSPEDFIKFLKYVKIINHVEIFEDEGKSAIEYFFNYKAEKEPVECDSLVQSSMLNEKPSIEFEEKNISLLKKHKSENINEINLINKNYEEKISELRSMNKERHLEKFLSFSTLLNYIITHDILNNTFVGSKRKLLTIHLVDKNNEDIGLLEKDITTLEDAVDEEGIVKIDSSVYFETVNTVVEKSEADEFEHRRKAGKTEEAENSEEFYLLYDFVDENYVQLKKYKGKQFENDERKIISDQLLFVSFKLNRSLSENEKNIDKESSVSN